MLRIGRSFNDYLSGSRIFQSSVSIISLEYDERIALEAPSVGPANYVD